MKRIKLLAGIACVCIAVSAQAASATDVRVTVGKVTEIVLPEKVAKVIKGGPAESVLIEVLDNTIYVLPKSNAMADIFVTGVSGASYPLKLTLAAQHDVRVDISGPAIKRVSRDNYADPMHLMKEVLQGKMPAGATVLKSGQPISLSEGRIKMKVEVIYDFPHMAAYIFKARNETRDNVIVPIEHITFPRMLAIHADVDMLRPKGQEGDSAMVYLVAGK